MTSFWHKFQNTSKQNKSLVCVGLDSDLTKIPQFLLTEDNPQLVFNREIIDATQSQAACYKPNLAFYLAAGEKGMKALYQTIAYIPSHIPVLLDCKVGDIGNTMGAYAKAFFNDMKVDAITVNPLMGKDVYEPCLDYPGKMLFLLALTSNPSAIDYLKLDDLYQYIAHDVALHDHTQVGAVVGATQTRDLQLMRKLMPESLFLIPGIGAQGGNVSDVMLSAIRDKSDPRILINSSRNIIFADGSHDFAVKAASAAEELRLEIQSYLS
jgi:orotidine-5'-phosphate decarboxylase